jgi:hypothetical protein
VQALKNPGNKCYVLGTFEDFPDVGVAGMAGMVGMLGNDKNISNICCKNESAMLQNGQECFKHASKFHNALAVKDGRNLQELFAKLGKSVSTSLCQNFLFFGGRGGV